MKLLCSAFAAGMPIPEKYTCEGADLSPPLYWQNPPRCSTTMST